MAALPARPKIVVADGHEYILAGVKVLLKDEFAVVATAKDGIELVRAVEESAPDLVITEIKMLRRNGIEAAEELVRRRLCNAIIILSMRGERVIVEHAFRIGVRGYVLKHYAGDELVLAARAVLEGNTYLSAALALSW